MSSVKNTEPATIHHTGRGDGGTDWVEEGGSARKENGGQAVGGEGRGEGRGGRKGRMRLVQKQDAALAALQGLHLL